MDLYTLRVEPRMDNAEEVFELFRGNFARMFEKPDLSSVVVQLNRKTGEVFILNIPEECHAVFYGLIWGILVALHNPPRVDSSLQATEEPLPELEFSQ